MKYILSLIMGLLTVSSCFAQNFLCCDDLVLICNGSPHRTRVDEKLLKPYLMHTFADGRQSWLFDGFLMIEGVYFEGDRSYTFGEAAYDQAPQSMWSKLPDIQLGVGKGVGCEALDKLIGELIPVLGKPAYKHQVVMTLPSAKGASLIWGDMGVDYDFSKLEDRIAAMKWYVDLLIEKWNEANFQNIELAGFFYVAEHAEERDIPAIKGVNDYIHSKGYISTWIPYFWAWNYQRWFEMGFDQVYYQPNYFFSTDVPLSRLDDAIEEAYNLNVDDMRFGMEMEFEGYNNDRYGNPYTPHNIGLYDYGNHVFYNRFVDYVNKFEEHDVFDMMPLAYYTGYQAVYDFANSANPKDHEILDRLASHLVERHTVGGWYTPSYASINDVIGDDVRVYGLPGEIVVSGKGGGAVSVYSIDGKLVYSDDKSADASSEYKYSIQCNPGIYIVKTGSRTVKVAVG